MRALLLLAILLPLSGCLGAPDVPDDALVVRDQELGLKMSSWYTEDSGRLRLRSIVENVGSDDVEIRTDCGEPWNSTLAPVGGEPVAYREFQEEPSCASYWDVLRPNGHMEFYHSWDFQNHDADEGTTWEAPGGPYVWRLRFELRDDVRFIETVVPIDVACSDKNPCDKLPGRLTGVHVDANVTPTEDGWMLQASAKNLGPETYKVSSICAPVWVDRIYDGDNQIEHHEPMATCEAYGVRDWPPGETLWHNTTWDGQVWTCYEGCGSTNAPAGDYRWVTTVETLEPSKDFDATIHFTVQ